MVPVVPMVKALPVLRSALARRLLASALNWDSQQALRPAERMLAATYRSPPTPPAVLLRLQDWHQSSLLHQ